MTAKEIFNGFKKQVGPTLNNPIKTAKAEAWAVLKLVEGYNEIQKARPAKTDAELFQLFDFMNSRAAKLRFRINAYYKVKPGVDVMKPGAFIEILSQRAPDALKFYRQYKNSPAEYMADQRTPLKVVK